MWAPGQPELRRACLTLRCSTFRSGDTIRMGSLHPSKPCQHRLCLGAIDTLARRAFFCAHHSAATIRNSTLRAPVETTSQHGIPHSGVNATAVHRTTVAGDTRGLRKTLMAAATCAIPAVETRDSSLRTLLLELHRRAWEAQHRILLIVKSSPGCLGLHENPARALHERNRPGGGHNASKPSSAAACST